METNVESQFASDMNLEPARPQFLSVLCILTWICSGLLFISTLWGVIFQPSPEKQQEQIEQIRAVSPEAADKMEEALESQSSGAKIMTNVLSLIAVSLCAYGALLMWQFKKTGFYIYLIGEALPYLGFLFGAADAMKASASMMGMSGSTFLGIAIAVMATFDGIFIAMYAANVKHMK